MAPEQVGRAATVGPATDVWALGAVLFLQCRGVGRCQSLDHGFAAGGQEADLGVASRTDGCS